MAQGKPTIIGSARKRGHKDDDILHAYRQPIRVFEPEDQEGFTMIVGGDQAGNLLEIGIVDSEEGPVIVHCMDCRPHYMP